MGHIRPLLFGGISNDMQDTPTYFRLCLDVNVVQSTAALTLIVELHPPLIHHFHWRNLILIREM
jgi:hypothetical protein